MVDSQEYCLRASCINKRKQRGENNQIRLSDIWADISRIKHKRDRDEHPCQLPEKLMERIISIYSNEGDFVFDPFSGAGTTAIVAKKLDRRYAAIDISPDYVEMGRSKLQQLVLQGEIFKPTVKKVKRTITKKQIEVYIQELCKNIGHRPDVEEFKMHLLNDDSAGFSYEDVLELFQDIKAALKSGRIVLKQ
jgi:SAM-dependent methyltransferase